MSARIEARVQHRFAAPPERIFDAWLDPAMVRVWLAAALRESGLAGEIGTVEIDPRPGGRFVFSDWRGGVEARHWGTYLELERPRRIAFTWIVDPSGEADPSRVTITIEPDGSGCIVTLVHEMDAAWVDYLSRTEAGWSRMLRASAAQAEPA